MSHIFIDATKPIRSGGTLVRLSLAVAAMMPLGTAAYAQFDANCTQFLRYDTVAVCAAGGALEITPKSGKTNATGCLYVMGSPKRGVCTFKSVPTNSGSVQIKVSDKTITLTGPGSLVVKSFNVAKDGGGPTKTFKNVKTTATPVSFGVGANATAVGGQAIGTYNGTVMMVLTFTP